MRPLNETLVVAELEKDAKSAGLRVPDVAGQLKDRGQMQDHTILLVLVELYSVGSTVLIAVGQGRELADEEHVVRRDVSLVAAEKVVIGDEVRVAEVQEDPDHDVLRLFVPWQKDHHGIRNSCHEDDMLDLRAVEEDLNKDSEEDVVKVTYESPMQTVVHEPTVRVLEEENEEDADLVLRSSKLIGNRKHDVIINLLEQLRSRLQQRLNHGGQRRIGQIYILLLY